MNTSKSLQVRFGEQFSKPAAGSQGRRISLRAMQSSLFRRETAAALSLSLLLSAMPAVTAAAEVPASQGQQISSAQLEQAIHNYILQHPEVVLESVRGLDQRVKLAQKQKAQALVESHLSELYSDSPSTKAASAASTKDEVTVVEFFDYRCGYCRKVEDTVAKIAENSGVRVVYKDFPILGPESLVAAKAALAADQQGGYVKFHHALLTSTEPLTAEVVEKIARASGLDVNRLKKDMDSPEVEATLDRNRELAGKLGIQSTPSFIVGKELVPGAIGADALQALIKNARGASPEGNKQTAAGP